MVRGTHGAFGCMPAKKPTGARFRGLPTGLCAILAGSLVAATAQAAGNGEREATLRLCATGTAVAVARAERSRGDAGVAVAGVLPNPSLIGEHQRSLRGPAEDETIIGVSVPLGIGGRRFVLQDAAARRRDEARATADATLFEGAVAFREAYTRAAAEEARVLVLTRQQGELEALTAVVQGLAMGGEAAGYDLLRQQAQVRLHRSTLQAARARAAASRALLAGWLEGLPPPTGLASIRAEAVAGGSPTPTPAVRALESRARAAALEARAARRRAVPDLDAFAGYRTVAADGDRGHGISLGLTLPLTLFDHGQGEAAEADAESALASALAEKLRREQTAQVGSARAKLDGLSQSLAEAERAATEALIIQDKSRLLYASGETTITELLDAFRVTEQAELAKIELAEELASTRFALMRAAGTLLDPALDRACGLRGTAGEP